MNFVPKPQRVPRLAAGSRRDSADGIRHVGSELARAAEQVHILAAEMSVEAMHDHLATVAGEDVLRLVEHMQTTSLDLAGSFAHLRDDGAPIA